MNNIFCCVRGNSSQETEESTAAPSAVAPPAAQPQAASGLSAIEEEHRFVNREFLDNAGVRSIFCCLRGSSSQSSHQASGSNNNNPQDSVHTFHWDDILNGTQNLHVANFIGHGNFGEVYRCNLPSIGKVGAAKIENLDNKNAEAHREYEAEIKALQAANHPNVIKILGKCIDQRRTVVYEFMPKGSLDHYLYAQTRPDRFGGLLQEYLVLNWETRMKIAVGVAHALVYLHEGLGLIHRDIKIANVLLDENFVPKLTDFGLATKVVRDRRGAERQIEIDPIKGTPGCAAPETLDYGMVSTKSDVYSYGVLLLTLFTGRKAHDRERPVDKMKITDWVCTKEQTLGLCFVTHK
ncbi:unnamed protein product [Cochlearia groenlandica]